MRPAYLLLFFLILFSCNSKNQKREETTIVDTAQMAEASPENAPSQTEEPEQPLTAKPFKRSTNPLENFRSIDNYQPEKSSEQLSVQDFIIRLGQPQSTIKDTDTLCPIGQLHFWNVTEYGYRIFALGDEYSAKDNLTAACRLYGIQLLDEKQIADYESFIGVKLGEDASIVEEKLKVFVKENPAYSFQRLKERSAVERFLTERQKSVFVLTDGKKYYHFAIGKKQKLTYILISAINVQEAC